MRTFKLTLEYDGTRFHGWQLQPRDRSVQGVLEDACATVLKESIRIHGAGRTDAGVHALGQVAHFSCETTIPTDGLFRGLNGNLPPDVAIIDLVEAPPEFHARFSAKGKHYRYQLFQARCHRPFLSPYAWRVRDDVDLAHLDRHLREFVGEHDFAAFRASSCSAKTTVRQIHAAWVTREEGVVGVHFRGGGFLQHQVRIMVGTLLENLEQGRPPTSIRTMLASGKRSSAGRTAPAHGLWLMRVFYDDET